MPVQWMKDNCFKNDGVIIGHQKTNTSNATSHIIKLLTQNTSQAKMQNNKTFRKKRGGGVFCI